MFHMYCLVRAKTQVSKIYFFKVREFLIEYNLAVPITVAARSKTWIVFARSNTRIVGSNPTRGMDVCVRLFCL
jgi:hypothetical protein